MEPLYTLKGSKIQRYQNNVGKHIGGCIYVHRLYMEEVIPKDILGKAIECIISNQLIIDLPCNTVVYNLKDKSVRFDSALNFNTEREPCVGKFIKVFADGRLKRGFSNSIWHHKWLWVKDDYKGFDVYEAYIWSGIWLSKLKEPASGSIKIWQEQLKKVGLK